ncbi:MAG: diaminopimelate epimerase [Neisseriaceae bacterium]
MTNIQFTKMHGLGNDFVVIDKTNQTFELDNKQIKFICNRKLGVGCDQLLIINNCNGANNEYQYRIFNSDGSESEHCGNGARCVIKYIYSHNNLTENNVTLHTKNRIITGSISKDRKIINVSMGIPSFKPQDIPFIHSFNPNNIYELELSNTSIQFGVASVGNPHVIVKLRSDAEMQDRKSLEKLAKLIQNSDYFPNGVNVNFYLKLDNNTIQLITYERGCGFTDACGTGACATATYGILQNYLEEEVKVLMPGGSIVVRWDKINQLMMIGEATEVFNGNLNLLI